MNTNLNKKKMTQENFESKQAEVSDTELIKTIETKLSKLCQTGGRSLSMSVPPKVSDIDMAICELIRRYKQLLITDVVVPKGTLLCSSCDGTGGRVIYDTYLKCKECNGCGAK